MLTFAGDETITRHEMALSSIVGDNEYPVVSGREVPAINLG
jgi:hypothetical protein